MVGGIGSINDWTSGEDDVIDTATRDGRKFWKFYQKTEEPKTPEKRQKGRSENRNFRFYRVSYIALHLNMHFYE